MHRSNPHACIACADRWFRGAVGLPGVASPRAGAAAAAASSRQQAQAEAEEAGYMRLLERALGTWETAEAGAHIAAHTAEALSMCSRTGEAVACLQRSLEVLADTTATQAVCS